MKPMLKITNTAIKTLSLLLLMNVTFACTNLENKVAQAIQTTQNEAKSKPTTGVGINVLGTQLFGSPSTVNANYNLNVKTAAKDSIANEQGSPTDGNEQTDAPKMIRK